MQVEGTYHRGHEVLQEGVVVLRVEPPLPVDEATSLLETGSEPHEEGQDVTAESGVGDGTSDDGGEDARDLVLGGVVRDEDQAEVQVDLRKVLVLLRERQEAAALVPDEVEDVLIEGGVAGDAAACLLC